MDSEPPRSLHRQEPLTFSGLVSMDTPRKLVAMTVSIRPVQSHRALPRFVVLGKGRALVRAVRELSYEAVS